MKNALLELFVEEIPVSLVPPVLSQIKSLMEAGFLENNLHYSKLSVYGTPRRLVVYTENLADKTEEKKDEVIGPPVTIAYDAEGNPTKAAIGFASSQNIDVKKLTVKETLKGKYICSEKNIPGISTDKILPLIFTEIIKSITFPKSMVWEETRFRFIRPLRNILAVYEPNKYLKFSVAGVKSANYTYGLYHLSNKKLKISSPEKYFSVLRNNNVVVDNVVRRELIVKLINDTAKRLKCRPADRKQGIDLNELVDEINYLVEYPTVIVGKFDEKYLSLPVQVLTNCMKIKQKFVPLVAESGKLTNSFIGIRNGISEYQENVREGYERVLTARLNDAQFFFNNDRQKPLSSNLDKLKGMVFHDKLGTMYDKTLRVVQLSGYIHGLINDRLDSASLDEVKRTAELCKCDLVTEMVYEYPELQGVIGRIYAKYSNESENIAAGIEEHYLPVSADGKLPKSSTGIIVSLADKIDTLVNDFSIGLIPTGSGDPYGLRRQAIGALRILIENNINISLNGMLEKSCEISNISADRQKKVVADLLDFFYQRYENILVDKGNKLDEIRAILSKKTGNMVDLDKWVAALHKIRKTSNDFEPVTAGYKRAANILKQAYAKGILKKEDSVAGYKDALIEPVEIELYNKISLLKPEISALLEQKKFEEVLYQLVTIRPFIDNFFEKILVMAQEEKLRTARLLLLQDVTTLFTQFMDFSQLGS